MNRPYRNHRKTKVRKYFWEKFVKSRKLRKIRKSRRNSRKSRKIHKSRKIRKYRIKQQGGNSLPVPQGSVVSMSLDPKDEYGVPVLVSRSIAEEELLDE